MIITIFSAIFFSYAENGQSFSTPEFSDFRIILERNIFDPDRRAKPAFSNASPQPTPVPTEEIRLVGTVINKGEAIAFFKGSDSSFNGQWKQGDTIAGLRIKEIGTRGLILENQRQKIEMKVGAGITTSNREKWTLTTKPAITDYHKKDKTDIKQEQKTDNNASDILKKLMERRKQEIDQ